MLFVRPALTALIVAVFASVASAQQVTPTDITRLQDNIYQAGSDITELRRRDNVRANQLQAELDELREEVIYLKVKLRKEGSLVRAEYADVRDRIEDVRTTARGDAQNAYSTTPAAPADRGTAQPRAGTTASTTTSTPTTARAGEIPAGTEMDVRLTGLLNSGTAQVEDRFEATTLVDFNAGGRTIVPAGSVMRGVVTSVEPATRTNRTAKMTLSFDQLTVNGRSYPIRGTVTEAIEGEGIKGEAGRVGTGAGVGAIIGGILGGFKGALAGILIGAGGTIAATEGREVELPQGSVLRVRLDSPVQIQATR
jgi:hypothetical protein